MPEEKLYNSESQEIDDQGELVLDEEGNAILKPEEKLDEETSEEKIAKLEQENEDIKKERDGIKGDLIESRGRRREAEDALSTHRNVPKMSKQEMEDWLEDCRAKYGEPPEDIIAGDYNY